MREDVVDAALPLAEDDFMGHDTRSLNLYQGARGLGAAREFEEAVTAWSLLSESNPEGKTDV